MLHRNAGPWIGRSAPAALGLLLIVASSGCFPVIPHYDTGSPTRMNVEKATEGFPIVGSSTREEVALRLGEPDEVAGKDERRWIYRWKKVVAVFASQYSSHPIFRTYELNIDFDGRGIVLAVVRS